MAAEHDVDMQERGESLAKTYIVIDTNILLDDLQAVQVLFRILSLPNLGSTIALLIPITVLYELDKHHKYGVEHVRHRAREANRFLHRLIKSRQVDRTIPFRVQKLSEMSEHVRAKSSSPDDQHILDCCLKFKEECEDIWLWTKDQIFDTIAESNDIRVLSRSDLAEIVIHLGIGDDPSVEKEINMYKSRSDRLTSPQEEDRGMDIDEDLYFDLPAMADDTPRAAVEDLAPGPDGKRSLLSDYLARYSGGISYNIQPEPFAPIVNSDMAHSSGFSTPTSLVSASSRNTPATPTKLSHYDIHDQFERLLEPLTTYLSIQPSRSDRFLQALLARLVELDKNLFPNSPERTTICDDQKKMLLGIDATRTLVRYCERDLYDRSPKPRVGAVVEAVEALGDFCLDLGLDEMLRQELRRLATAVRAS